MDLTRVELLHDIKQGLISKIDIFQELSVRDMGRIDQQMTMTSCEAGQVLYRPDEQGEMLFLLKNGRVQLYRLSPEGKKLVVALLDPGDLFGEMSLVGQGMHNTFAESISECTLCVMSRPALVRLVQEKPEVALRFMQLMALRLQRAEIMMEDLAFKGIPARLSSLLVSLSKNEGETKAVQGFSHQDLAEMLGTYRETTTQILNNLKARGWIDIGRRHIALIDPQGMLSGTTLP